MSSYTVSRRQADGIECHASQACSAHNQRQQLDSSRSSLLHRLTERLTNRTGGLNNPAGQLWWNVSERKAGRISVVYFFFPLLSLSLFRSAIGIKPCTCSRVREREGRATLTWKPLIGLYQCPQTWTFEENRETVHLHELATAAVLILIGCNALLSVKSILRLRPSVCWWGTP